MSELNGQSITTVEALAGPEGPSPLQQAFLDEFAFQCGYCTPGFLIAANMLMERLRAEPIPRPSSMRPSSMPVGTTSAAARATSRYYTAIRKVILATPGLVRR